MNLIESFVRNPVKVSVGVLLTALFGVIAAFRLPMQLTPEVQQPSLTVETRWPGASAQEVEREIVQEQEEQLKSVEGLTKLSSESNDSRASVTLEFAVGTDMSEALLKVNTRLAQVPRYPEGVREPVISTADSSSSPIAWFTLQTLTPSDEALASFAKAHPELAADIDRARRSHSSGLRLARLRQLAERHPAVRRELLIQRGGGVLDERADTAPPKNTEDASASTAATPVGSFGEIDIPKLRRFVEDVIEARFERVSGVANANVFGGEEEELQVVVDPRRLAARGLTILDLRRALEARNVDTSAGDYQEGKRRYVVRTLGKFTSIKEVTDALVSRVDGLPVYVGDVAEVKIGYKKPDGMVRRFGSSSMAINCVRESGANVLDVMEGLRQAVAELNKNALNPRGLHLEQVYDETEYIHSAIDLVKQNILIGGLLTVLILLLFLRSGRSTVIIALAIPVSIIGTFLILSLLGRSFNVISLAGLAFAVGMLVDNAVVVLENIYRRYQLGEQPWTAAIRGTKEVWGAVIASTLTTLAVFLPVLFVKEEAGQLFRDIAIAISGAVGLSLIVSVVVISTAASRVLRKAMPAASPLGGDVVTGARPLNRLLAPLDAFARAFVARVTTINLWLQRDTRRGLLAALAFVGAAVGLSLMLAPRIEYLPTGNRNLVFGIMLPPPGYNLDQMIDMGRFVENELRPYWDVDPDDPKLDELPHPPIGDFFYVARGRQIFLGLRAMDPRRAAELLPLIFQFNGKIPGVIAVGFQSSLFGRGLSAGRAIDVEFTGPELETLVGLGGRTMGMVADILPGAQARPLPSLDLSNPEVHVTPRQDRAKDFGIEAGELGYTVDALVDGAFAGEFFTGGRKIDLRIVGEEGQATSLQSLSDLPMALPGGATGRRGDAGGSIVPLSAIADIRLSSGPEQINRRERERAITIQITPSEDVPLGLAVERIEREIVEPMRSDGALSGGYQVTIAGAANKLAATWDALKFNFVLALLITYLLMAALFESWLYPLVIILTVPLGAVGGLAGLALLNVFTPQSLDVLTMLGFIILIGTVVNNAILIVHQALLLMREENKSKQVYTESDRCGNDAPGYKQGIARLQSVKTFSGQLSDEAIVESVRTRIRPVLMTTLTTVFGLLPLVVAPGAGSELYRGLGVVVLGGMLTATLVTLVLVPTVFSLTMRAADRFALRLTRKT